MVDAFTLGDFLVESTCHRGHASSLAFRGYRRKQVECVAKLLTLDRCAWLLTTDGDRCGATTRHDVHELGASDEDARKLAAFRTADTLPAMGAVVEPPGPRSSMPPPMPEDGPVTAGD